MGQGRQGICNNCRKECGELVPTTDVCEPCLLESQAQFDFCYVHLLSFRKNKRCAVCEAGYPAPGYGQPRPNYPPEVEAKILEVLK
jgi:hypothetical protein